METHDTEIIKTETLTNPRNALSPSPSLVKNAGHEVGGIRGITGEDLSSKVINTTYYPPKYSIAQTEEYRQVMFDIRNMRVLSTYNRIAVYQFSREQLLEMIEIYDLIMKNVNYLFS